MSAHFAPMTRVVIAKRRGGIIVARDGVGGMTVRWDDGPTEYVRPYALAHEALR